MKEDHILHRERDSDLACAPEQLKHTTFADAPFWNNRPPPTWRLSRVISAVNMVDAWLDPDGRHPFSQEAVNRVAGKRITEVLRVIRNALAHGNIIYLNEHGREVPGERMHFIAFLSRYEETDAQRKKAETYRVLFVREPDFLSFVKQWAGWIGSLGADQTIAEGIPGQAA
ncbi:MAG: hypothetical protein P4M09_17430 [Devosia sp.]|nr:hypothetical protein [Devosia sp.]